MKYLQLPQLNRGQSNSAFTLFEAMIVLALICIMVALGGAQLSYFNRMHARRELDRLQTVCRYLQYRAITLQQEHVLYLDTRNQKYSFLTSEHFLPSHCRFGFLPGSKGPPASPKTLIQDSVTFTDKRIRFSPTGVLKAGTIYLCAGETDMYALTIPVSRVSYLRKYRYTQNKWHDITE